MKKRSDFGLDFRRVFDHCLDGFGRLKWKENRIKNETKTGPQKMLMFVRHGPEKLGKMKAPGRVRKGYL